MEKWQLETAERLASIERSIKYIELNLTNLPPSPTCVINDSRLEKRIESLEEFKKYVLIRVAWISGAFAVVTSGLISSLDSIKLFFKSL
jgi:hypothetical protein